MHPISGGSEFKSHWQPGFFCPFVPSPIKFNFEFESSQCVYRAVIISYFMAQKDKLAINFDYLESTKASEIVTISTKAKII